MTAGELPADLSRVALDLLDDGVVILAADGSIAFANAAMAHLVGETQPDLAGQSGFELLHPDDMPEAQRLFGHFFEDVRVPGTVTFRIRNRESGWVPVEATAAMIEHGGAALVVVSMREVANRTWLASRERYSSQFLRALLENVQVGIVACDAEGRVLVFNEQMRTQHKQPDGRQRIDEWITHAEYFEADGVTPLSFEQSPLYRTLRGEVVKDVEYAARAMDGSIKHRRANGQILTDEQGVKIGAFVAVEDLTEQRVAEEALRQQALYDPLTGLPNRLLLTDRLLASIARTAAGHDAPVVFFLDLDNFKVVNDSLGHSAGDRLLVEIARRLADLCGPHATVARLGGDEFVIATESGGAERDVTAAAQEIIDAVTEPVAIDGTDVRVTASIGVALSHGRNDTAERLLRDADTAMYLAKDNGRNRWEVFDRSLRDAVVRRMEAEQSLRKAINDGRLVVAFQPIVDAATHTVCGFEALARYVEEDGRLVVPDEFIEVAEQTGLISRIDMFVFEQGCQFAASINWPEGRGSAPYISCNFSAGTLTREDLVPIVLGQLNRHSIDPSRLRLELTETTLITATRHTRNALAVLRAAGVGIGIDDFGTGYSSLTYLRDLPVSFVKIDRSFIQGLLASLEDAAIVRAVVRLARALGKSVTAEGVELPEQARVLEGFGCDGLQGFLFGEGVPAEEALGLVTRTFEVAA